MSQENGFFGVPYRKMSEVSGEMESGWNQRTVKAGVVSRSSPDSFPQLPDQVPLRFITNALRRAFTRATTEQATGIRQAAQEIADECGIDRAEMRRLVVDGRIHELRSEFEDLDFMNRWSDEFDDAS